jgi:WD40 repeat protein
LAAGAANGAVLLWELPQRTSLPVSLPTLRPITALELSEEGWLVVGGTEQHVLAWDIANRKARKLPMFPAPITALKTRPRQPELFVGLNNGELHIVQLREGKVAKFAAGHAGGIKALAFNPIGTQLVTGGTDGKLIWRDAQTRQVLRAVEAHGHEISSLAFSPDGRLLISAGWDNAAKIWNASDGSALTELPHPEPVSCVACTETQIVTGCWDGKLRTFPLAGGPPQAELETGEAVHALAVNPGGTVAATAAQSPAVQFWKLTR